jgi:hypothetical protein
MAPGAGSVGSTERQVISFVGIFLDAMMIVEYALFSIKNAEG